MNVPPGWEENEEIKRVNGEVVKDGWMRECVGRKKRQMNVKRGSTLDKKCFEGKIWNNG